MATENANILAQLQATLATMQAETAALRTQLAESTAQQLQAQRQAFVTQQIQSLELAAAKTQLALQAELLTKRSGGGEFKLDQKIVKQPTDFSGDASDWERFKFALTTWITIVDPRFPELLKTASKQRDELESVDMDVDVEKLAGGLFALLVGLCPKGDVPTMARLVPNSNGFELSLSRVSRKPRTNL